ncbi:hypothetical protein K788_0003278 [Paraburkholderia caribensis MBA4]|uniref:Uncharacterized protein n=1 Tax=Paraburkholderia caribensis MBA4 TaxID=1323664 RepID=A0A0P0RDB1_9BURK|nr:hypothetical protein [Paraburkholderia caribensis]ALL66135.1 hypothetical protein K788_0003278 [Paraburkholderia caribensis MBA4]
MNAFVRSEGSKRDQLDELAVAYARAYRRCLDPHARRMGDALRGAVAYLWNAGGGKNVSASIRAAQLAILSVSPVKLSDGTNEHLCVARMDANGAIGFELGDDDARAAKIRPLDEVAEVFWFRGDDKHGRATVAVLEVMECLLTAEVSV